ncbi:pentatricopeptide repeat-containing protein At2g15630, mitochondrial-like isoform X3 [Vigna unguiculata]|uniref:pentatricopeptide repeat-containing protein At2g15630, mitochondrial-like isoform X3 n=1 Tax=Vigna unguiculata TaxID=3917 RepID=UPI0010163221|nr:pentatricopeptide repeat-containing protein At2g15630, mitochondrial-like isoform X3 [Vigna unguiculata]
MVCVQTQPGFARGLADGLLKFVRSEGTLGYAYKVSTEISPSIMKFLKIFKSKPFNLRTFSSLSLPTIVTPITESELLNSIESSQWHFIKHAAPHYTPSLLSSTLTSLRHKPQVVLQLLSHLNDHPHSLDLTTSSLAACILCCLPSPKPSINLLQSLILCSTVTNKTIFYELELSRDRVDAKTSLIFDLLARAYCELKKPNEVLECFYLMKEKGVEPNIETCNQMLSLFLRLNRTHMAWVLYAEMFTMKIKSSVYTFNIMVNVLCKEGKLKKAKEFIEYMEALGVKPNVVTYNTVIHGHCLRGKFQMARVIFQTMKDKGLEPDCYTYNSFISGLCKERRLEEATGLLCKMLEIGLVPNAVTYNALIDGFCNKGDLDKAFACRDEMISKGVTTTLVTYNLFIHALFMEGRMGEADNMIKEMREKGMKPDAVTYNILINGYCRCGDAKRAFSLLDEMVGKGIQPTLVTYTSLISVLGKRNRMKEADALFNKVQQEGLLVDAVMFNALIDGHCANGNIDSAFQLLKQMDNMKVLPDEITYNTLMQGYCREGKVEEAKQLLDEMKRRGIKPDHISYNTLISGYSKRGDMKDAFRVRDEMLTTGFDPTILTYNALIQGLCKNGEGEHAEELLKEMIKLPVHLRVGLCSRPPQRVCVQEVLEREVRLSYWNKVKQWRSWRNKSDMVLLKDIVPAAHNNIESKFIVLEKGSTALEGKNRICLTLVADETAAVHLQLWGDECNAFDSGDIIHLRKGIFSYQHGNLILRAGKRGKLEKSGEFVMSYVEIPNMSEIHWIPHATNSKYYIQDYVISPHSRIFPPIP